VAHTPPLRQKKQEDKLNRVKSESQEERRPSKSAEGPTPATM